MRKLSTLVLVALGVATQSCNDEKFNEIEEVVMKREIPEIPTTDDEEEEDYPPLK